MLNSIDQASRWFGEKASYVYLIATAIIGYEVAARYLFNSPTIWVHESVIALSAFGFLVGGLYALHRSEHIRISVVYQILPTRVRRILDVMNSGLTLTYLGCLGWGAFIVAKQAWLTGETSASAWNQPTPIIIKTVLVIAVAMIFALSFVHLVEHIQRKETISADDDPGAA